MNTDYQQPKRDYASPLRAGQANQTRNRIIEAFAEQIVDGGLEDFSIERVARRAGVSTRTIYHHFPKREDLLDAISAWSDEQAGVLGIKDPIEVNDFLERLQAVFVSFDEQETFIRAQLMTQLGKTVRERGRSQRRPAIEAIVRRAAPYLAPEEVQRTTSVIHYLTSSEAWRSLKDESGMTGREAGEAVTWAIRTLLSAGSESTK
jgi:AcrR family transcriptional regulator